MKFGVAAGVDKAEAVKTAGYDLLELSVSWYLYQKSDKEIMSIVRQIEDAGLKLESCNMLIHDSVTPLYRDENLENVREYLKRLMPSLSLAGIKTAIFGSMGYRHMPAEVPEAKQHALLVEFMGMLADMAKEAGIVIAVEPLSSREKSVLTTSREAMGYIKEINHPNLKLLIDLFPFTMENEPVSRACEYGPYLRHIHVAEPSRRDYLRLTDEYDYTPFFDALKKGGYDGPIVLEGGRDDFEEGIVSTMEVLRKHFG